ncbi:hypothetical protein UP10_24195 [Bradyrhizobium sp. LTSPM299]|nr:hypothetical protein UP10_24195 [Bradyrhizobium sp. LTSPM299]
MERIAGQALLLLRCVRLGLLVAVRGGITTRATGEGTPDKPGYPRKAGAGHSGFNPRVLLRAVDLAFLPFLLPPLCHIAG